jgi:hypothetical protein
LTFDHAGDELNAPATCRYCGEQFVGDQLEDRQLAFHAELRHGFKKCLASNSTEKATSVAILGKSIVLKTTLS